MQTKAIILLAAFATLSFIEAAPAGLVKRVNCNNSACCEISVYDNCVNFEAFLHSGLPMAAIVTAVFKIGDNKQVYMLTFYYQ